MATIDTKVIIKSLAGAIVWQGYADDDSSYRIKTIMGDNKLFIRFSSDVPVQIPLFAWTEFKGERYFLLNPNNFTKKNTENHEYTLEMDTYQAYLKSQKYEFFTPANINNPEITFSLSATPQRFAQLAADNMNLKDSEGGWAVGECIEADEANLDFDDMTIWDALNMVAEKFSTEWEIETKTINIRKVEKLPENPVPLTYGQGGGILGGGTHSKGGSQGITRSNASGRVGVLRAKTSNRNIDQSTYGYNSLRMPREYLYDYTGVRYTTDATGTKLRRYTQGNNHPILPESTLDLTNIYPMREGVISSAQTEELQTDDGGKELFYTFADDSIPDTLNYEDYLIEGTTMTVVFQSGSLSGMEFEVKYSHADRKFILLYNTESGAKYPNPAMQPGVSDKYVVLNIMLPDEYIQTAEMKILQKMAEYLYENEGDRYTFSFELDPIYAKKNWGAISGFLNIGYFIRFSDPQYLAAPIDIRITEIKEYVNRPYSPKLTIANSLKGQSVAADIRQSQNVNQTIRREGKSISKLSNVRWRDLTELYEYLHSLIDLGFSEGIKPVAINTMMAYLGAEILQYRWVDQKTDPVTEIDMNLEMNDDTQTFSADGGIIQHMTIGIDTMQPEHGANAYKFWDVAPFPPTYVGDRGFLWLYIKAEKEGTNATFLFSETEIEPESVPGYYHFLCGTLSSPFEGSRSFVPWYGYAVITPGQLRIPKIASTDGTQFWDMLNKAFFIGNGDSSLSYNINGDGQVVLKGTLVQSKSGITTTIDVFRGAYSSSARYYLGDLVTYSGSTYRCKSNSNTGITGLLPTNTTYWDIYAQKGANGTNGTNGANGQDGMNGEDGQGYLYAYYASDSLTPPATPSTFANTIPSGWWSYPNFNGHRFIYVSQKIYYSGGWGAWSAPTLYGRMPEDGNPGPAIVFRGDYNSIPVSERVFYNNAARRDVVKYNGTYYIWNYTDATIHGSWYAPRWESFGAQFSSVATDLLLAVNANIGGWIFKNERLESQSGGAFLDGRTGTVNITGALTSNSSGNRIIVDSANRSIQFINSSGVKLAEWIFKDNYSSIHIGDNANGGANGASISDDGIYFQHSSTEHSSIDSSGRLYCNNKGGDFTITPSTYSSSGVTVLGVLMRNLPTSQSGLTSGWLWRDGNTLRIVP